MNLFGLGLKMNLTIGIETVQRDLSCFLDSLEKRFFSVASARRADVMHRFRPAVLFTQSVSMHSWRHLFEHVTVKVRPLSFNTPKLVFEFALFA
jgi:hypothetical protein